MNTRSVAVGRFVQNLDEKDVVVVSSLARKKLEDCLSKINTTTLIARLDMAPWEGEGIPPIYEVEVSPDGLMFWGLFGAFPKNKISPLADIALCIDLPWKEAYQLLSELLGWQVVYDWDEISQGSRVYVSADPNDVPGEARSRLERGEFSLVTDPFCPKTEAIKITDGLILRPGDGIASFGELAKRFPNGFVLKPVWGYGSRDIHMHPIGPSYGYLRSHGGCSRDTIKELLCRPRQEDWMLQPFFAPEIIRSFGTTEFRIWRIFAVRQSQSESFKLLGGLWNQRASLKVHGASNTTSGLIEMAGKNRKATPVQGTQRKPRGEEPSFGWYM